MADEAMTRPDLTNAIAAVEAEIVKLKGDQRNYEHAMLPVPDWIPRRLQALKLSATTLRQSLNAKTNRGENR